NIFSKNSKSPAFATDWIPEKPSVTLPTGIEKEESEMVPNEYKLMQNYPNPFNPETTIGYKLQAASQVSLKVYDVLGNEIATLVDEVKPAGNHSTLFTLRSSFASGIYFYTITAGNYRQTRKMLLLK
ncbi:MAG: T9SS type A sorting domain-containing protein, partial [Ignavibacteria bacterium]|nr:T9SS type A sorting domain-containing protein [Ignavibacteria bacterium]